MSNKPNFQNTVNLAEYRQERLDNGAINIDLGDGTPPVVIPSPELWPDELPSFVRQPVEFAKGVLGESEWDRFAAAGGTARLLNSIFDTVTKERQGVTPGE